MAPQVPQCLRQLRHGEPLGGILPPQLCLKTDPFRAAPGQLIGQCGDLRPAFDGSHQ